MAWTSEKVSPQVAWLRTPEAIRERCEKLFKIGLDGELAHFDIDLEALPAAADRVAEVTLSSYPDLRVPVHGRMRHFEAGGVPRSVELAAALSGLSAAETARAKLDLIVVSVLLDAGAGAVWRYEESPGRVFGRSEGLAVASFRMFMAGAFAADHRQPLRADGAALAALPRETLEAGFQVSELNTLVGIDGRLHLLHGLGRALPRPGALYDLLAEAHPGGEVPARAILAAVLEHLGPIWPGRVELDGVNLGDVWPHPRLAAPTAPLADQLVPFHKLSQWLTYSMIEVLEEAGLVVGGVNELTGLAEYRNGGLFVDTGVLRPREATLGHHALSIGDTAVVEWRACTVALLDRIAPLVRARLGKGEEELPLASILEGGTWAAGRRLAMEKRGGGPPIRLNSDGTVF